MVVGGAFARTHRDAVADAHEWLASLGGVQTEWVHPPITGRARAGLFEVDQAQVEAGREVWSFRTDQTHPLRTQDAGRDE